VAAVRHFNKAGTPASKERSGLIGINAAPAQRQRTDQGRVFGVCRVLATPSRESFRPMLEEVVDLVDGDGVAHVEVLMHNA
jgi:hypothetical protein